MIGPHVRSEPASRAEREMLEMLKLTCFYYKQHSTSLRTAGEAADAGITCLHANSHYWTSAFLILG